MVRAITIINITVKHIPWLVYNNYSFGERYNKYYSLLFSLIIVLVITVKATVTGSVSSMMKLSIRVILVYSYRCSYPHANVPILIMISLKIVLAQNGIYLVVLFVNAT